MDCGLSVGVSQGFSDEENHVKIATEIKHIQSYLKIRCRWLTMYRELVAGGIQCSRNTAPKLKQRQERTKAPHFDY
jgi:hypothetical protein